MLDLEKLNRLGIWITVGLLAVLAAGYMDSDNVNSELFYVHFFLFSAATLVRLFFGIASSNYKFNLTLDFALSTYIFALFPPALGIICHITQAATLTILYQPVQIKPRLIYFHNLTPLFTLCLGALRGILFALDIKFSLLQFNEFSPAQYGLIMAFSAMAIGYYFLDRIPYSYESLRTKLALKEKKWTLDVLSLLSHNIRTPISAISQRIAILHLKIDQGLPITYEDIESLENSNNNVQNVLHQLLDTTARNAIRASNKSTTNLAYLINHIEEKDISIVNTHKVDFEMPTTSAISLQLCLDSLLSNARKYGNGFIKILIEEYVSEHCYTITVADNGAGMTPEQIEDYGTPFNKKTTSGGTGLGVYFTLGIIKELGWTWELKSQIGEGTQVGIRIPKTTLFV